MNIPENLIYSKNHEWIKVNNTDNCIGITDYAQRELGDIVFMELPDVGKKVSKGDVVGTIEAVKTVADIYSPISGEVIEVNSLLEDKPELLNSDPYGKGWIFLIKSDKSTDESIGLNSSEYKDFIGD